MDCHATAIALARNDRKKAESAKVDSRETPKLRHRKLCALAKRGDPYLR